MKRFENIFVGMVAIVCALYLFFAVQMDMGSLSRPGPGFVPTAFGAMGLVVALVLLINNIRKEKAGAAGKPAKAARPGPGGVTAAQATARPAAGVETASVADAAAGAEAASVADAVIAETASVSEAVVAAESANAPAGQGHAGIDREGFMRFLGYLIVSILFIPALMYLGAVITIFALILALTKISGARGWIMPIVFAAICSATSYALFELALHVSLPRGIF